MSCSLLMLPSLSSSASSGPFFLFYPAILFLLFILLALKTTTHFVHLIHFNNFISCAYWVRVLFALNLFTYRLGKITLSYSHFLFLPFFFWKILNFRLSMLKISLFHMLNDKKVEETRGSKKEPRKEELVKQDR